MENQVYWLNKALDHCVKQVPIANGWELFNEYGYAGTFKTLELALAANDAMNDPKHCNCDACQNGYGH